MGRLYGYVGTEDIRDKCRGQPPGHAVQTPQDVLRWISETGQQPDDTGLVPATFVLDEARELRIADRHIEHFACAGATRVYSAGEMYFEVEGSNVELVEVTNQSTGYCPEPTSWGELVSVLDSVGIIHPGCFTHEFEFRRCLQCRERNVVKEDWWVCAICGADLPREYNLG